MKYVHQIPVMLSLFLSENYPLSPNRSRKLMTLVTTCLGWCGGPHPSHHGVEGARDPFQLGAGQESRHRRCGALGWKRRERSG